MSINLPKDKQAKIIESLKYYFEENMDTEIGDLKASFLLEFILKEIGPSIYNQAILDAQSVMADKVSDLDNTCYEPEFMYWEK